MILLVTPITTFRLLNLDLSRSSTHVVEATTFFIQALLLCCLTLPWQWRLLHFSFSIFRHWTPARYRPDRHSTIFGNFNFCNREWLVHSSDISVVGCEVEQFAMANNLFQQNDLYTLNGSIWRLRSWSQSYPEHPTQTSFVPRLVHRTYVLSRSSSTLPTTLDHWFPSPCRSLIPPGLFFNVWIFPFRTFQNQANENPSNGLTMHVTMLSAWGVKRSTVGAPRSPPPQIIAL